MRRGNLYAPLFILVVTVPIFVGGAGLASFLLLRAGYGFAVGGLLPFLAMLVLVGGLGIILGRTVSGNSLGGDPEEKPLEGSSREGRGDDV